MTHTPNEYAKRILKNRSLKATPTRISLINLIHAYKTAMPFSKVQQQMVDTDRVTMYRTLNALLEKGIIHKAFSSQEDTYYALCGETCSSHSHLHDHIHFKCTACNAVTCQHLDNDIAISLPGFDIKGLSINAEGICPNCL